MSNGAQGLPQRQFFRRADDFGSMVSKLFQPVEFESAAPRFDAEIEAYQEDDILLSLVSTVRHQIHHTTDASAPGAERRAPAAPLKVMTPIGGAAVLRQYNREITLEPGGLALLDTTEQYWIDGNSAFKFLILMIPRQRLGFDNASLADFMAAPLADGSLADVVVPYLTALARNLTVCATPAGSRLAHNTTDLIATVLRAQLGRQRSEAESHKAELLDRAREYVLAHLDDRSLNPGTIAAAVHVSTRHLHSLFRETGVSVAAYVRSERIEASRRDLLDPLSAHLSVTDIAVRRGFADGAHFTHAFKAAHGTTPSDYRKACAVRQG